MKSANHDEYVTQLRKNWSDECIDRALEYLVKHVGFVTRREQARYLAYVFEYLPDDDGSMQVYGVSVRSARKHLDLPLTRDDF